MKKFTIIAAALLVLTAGCKSEEQKVADYNAATEKFMEDYNAATEKIRADSTLTDEARMAALEKNFDETVSKFVDERVALIKKNPSGQLALAALKDVWNNLETAQQAEVLDCLKGEAAKDSTVLEYRAALDTRLSTAEGQMFTDFTIVQDPAKPEESTVRFSDYVGKGKYVLVDFWASWCGPCKREIPNIASVYEKYKGDDFDVLSVAVWDKPGDTVAAAKEHGVVWSQIINAQRIPTAIYGIEGIPHIMLIGPDGVIIKRGLRGEAIGKAVAEALGR